MLVCFQIATLVVGKLVARQYRVRKGVRLSKRGIKLAKLIRLSFEAIEVRSILKNFARVSEISFLIKLVLDMLLKHDAEMKYDWLIQKVGIVALVKVLSKIMTALTLAMPYT